MSILLTPFDPWVRLSLSNKEVKEANWKRNAGFKSSQLEQKRVAPIIVILFGVDSIIRFDQVMLGETLRQSSQPNQS